VDETRSLVCGDDVARFWSFLGNGTASSKPGARGPCLPLDEELTEPRCAKCAELLALC